MQDIHRTFRVFVSSTFDDLKEEREALQGSVFPALAKECTALEGRFQAVDLRWGVRDEAALNQRTMEICFAEIERCQRTGVKPNFILLLGNRYGWRPLPSQIKAPEFEQILSVASQAEQRWLKYDESFSARSPGWYRRDENADPVVYTLRPRELNVAADASKDDRNDASDLEADAWAHTEDDLRALFCSAIERLDWPANDPRRIKYEASATHQEILKGLGSTSEERDHVFAFFRTGPKVDLDNDLDKLRRSLERELGSNVVEYPAGDLDGFCKKVLEKLLPVIQSQADLLKKRTFIRSEIELHDRVARDYERLFCGRSDELRSISSYLDSPSHRPLVVHGESGSGKSAIMAKASGQTASTHPKALVVRRFIGASPSSSDGLHLVEDICKQIAEDRGQEVEVRIQFNEMVRVLLEQLQGTSSDRPLILFIDGLNQLRPHDPVSTHPWLPAQLPPNCGVVLSSIEIPRFPEGAHLLAVKPFSKSEASDALSYWLKDSGRTLQSDQRGAVLASFERSPLPLYLKLAFEEARNWTSFQGRHQCLLGEGLGGIIDRTINRLSEEENHGPVLVARALGYLSAARHGLAEDEIVDVLNRDDTIWDDFISRSHHTPPRHRLPPIVWSRLFFDLKPYLNEYRDPSGNLLAFYHGKITDRIAARFLDGETRPRAHNVIAEYFRDVANPGHEENWNGGSARALGELPYHVAFAGNSAGLVKLLMSLSYLAARVSAGGAYQLAQDYALPGASPQTAPWRDFIQIHSQRLTDHPDMLVALVQLEGFPAARAQVSVRTWPQPWLCTSPEPLPATTQIASDLCVAIHVARDFPGGRIIAAAGEAGLAFRLAQLGSVSIFDCRNMQELLTRISIGSARPIRMVCAPDASSVLVIFDSGKAELHRCSLGADGVPAGSALMAEFPCILPEIDDPAAEWHNEAFWFQIHAGKLARVDARTAAVEEISLPGSGNRELAALLFLSGGKRFIAVRQQKDIMLANAEGAFILRERVDLTSACACGERAAIAFTDGETTLYDLAPGPVPVASVKTGVVIGALGWDGRRLLWLGESAPAPKFRVWLPGSSESLVVQDGEKIFPASFQVIPQAWVEDGEGSCLALTSHTMVRFHLETGGVGRTGRIDQLFGGLTWRAVRKTGNTQWLWESRPLRQTTLGTDIPGRLYCAIDGKGYFFTARVDRPGIVWKLSDLGTSTIEDSGMPLNGAAGDPDGGCWFCDRKGGIYFAGDDRRLRLAGTVNEGIGSSLHLCGDYLLWRGTIPTFFPGFGIDQARSFVFFKRRPGRRGPLEHAGQQLFPVRDGLCIDMDYDPASGRLVILWQLESKIVVLRTACVEDFLSGRFTGREVHGAGLLGAARISVSPDGHLLGVVNSLGEFVCVNIADGKIIAILGGSLPFTHLAPAGQGACFWLVRGQDSIYHCELMRQT